jgi:hypothetical protein
MPLLFNDALDDPIQFDVSQSFEGGMVSNQRATDLAANQAALIVNCDVTRIGELTTRRGTARVGGTTVSGSNPILRMTRFSTASGTEQLVASVYDASFPNKRLFYYVDGGAWTQANSIPVAGGYCPIVQGVNKLYMRGSDNHLYSWDGTTATDLNAGGGNHPPLGGPWLEWFTDRLIAADGRDALAFSDILDPTNWPVANSIRVGAGEDDVILGGCKWTDFNIVVAKRRSLWVVNCDPTLTPADFEIKCLHSKVGSRAPQTFVQVGADVIGLTTHGVRSMTRTFAAEHQSELGPSLSYPIEDFINRINKTYISTACAYYWKNRYILSVPLDSAISPNYTFVYNTLTQTWTGYWTGWNPTAFAERLITADGSLRLVFGDSSGNVFEWMDYVAVASEVTATFQDNGSAIASRLTTKAFNFGEPVSPKTGITCEVEYTSAGTLTGQLVADSANVGSAVSLSSGQTRKAFDVQSVGQFRELQLDLNSTSGKQTIRKIQVGGLIDTMVLQGP